MNNSVLNPDENRPQEIHSIRSQLKNYLEWLKLCGVNDVPSGPKIEVVSAGLEAQTVHPSLSSPESSSMSSNCMNSVVKETVLLRPSVIESSASSTKGLDARRTLVQYPELPDPVPWQGQEGLDRIREILGDCKRCKLHHGRNQLVFGQGDPNASLVFVGEGPGAEEDRTGLPFVGAAGELLNRMIAAMGLKREQVYICNVVKCRPPGNRTPETEEVSQCSPFLRAQLQALCPKVIVALGATPTRFLLNTSAPMSRVRGKFSTYEEIPVMPTYHPAYLLRTPSAKKLVWEDLKLVMARLNLNE